MGKCTKGLVKIALLPIIDVKIQLAKSLLSSYFELFSAQIPEIEWIRFKLQSLL